MKNQTYYEIIIIYVNIHQIDLLFPHKQLSTLITLIISLI